MDWNVATGPKKANLMQRPFEGIRVIDATHVLAGPFAAYQLAVLGADVIKIENPSEPDQVRIQGTSGDLNRRKMGTQFLAQASNKRSLTLDLKKPAAQSAFKRLVTTADVVIENYRPGAFAALGLGYDHLAALQPRLIYCSVSAYGQDGPRGAQTGYDNVIQASSGIMEMTGTREVHPVKLGAPAIDYGTGAMAAFALASALFQRERTGLGQRIDLSMLDAAMMLMASHITGYTAGGVEPRPIGNDYPVATIGAFETSDGMIMLGAANLRQQRRLWIALGHPEMIKQTTEERVAAWQEETALLRSIFIGRTSTAWEEFLQGKRIPASPVRRMADALRDPQLRSRALLHHHPDVPDAGPVTVPVAAFRFDHGGPSLETPPPRPGEHSDAILAELGYGPAEISAMREQGVI